MAKQLYTFILIIFSLPVFAQFSGGEGDGANQRIISTSLNGVNAGMLFSGGNADGYVNKGGTFSLDGNIIASLYKGGQGDGFDKLIYNGSLGGTDASMLYSGGTGDGFDKKPFSGSLDGSGMLLIYNGGTGDGFNVKPFSGGLDGGLMDMLYKGGQADGFSVAQVQALLNGTEISSLFSGGDGDGFANALFSGTLVVLPIELISFDATARDNYVLVKWITASEQNNDFYTIERSVNGVLFNKLMVVPGKGNSQTVQVYTENDNNPLQGRSYYRLKWTDIEGGSAYSEIRSVLFNKKETKDFLLFPNPNDGNIIYVQLDGVTAVENIAISITDMQGKLIYQSPKPTINSNRIGISLSRKLAAGSYVVKLIRNGEASSKVLIVR